MALRRLRSAAIRDDQRYHPIVLARKKLADVNAAARLQVVGYGDIGIGK